jgi:long-chain fatty acid transport protein
MRLRTQVGWWTVAAVCAEPAAPHTATAQGFGLNEIGSCAIARGFATTGAPCDDASVLYWNPAAATRLRGLSIYGGVTGVQVNGRFTQDVTAREFEGDVPVEYPPFLGVNWKGSGTGAAGRLALGLAAYVPYGLTSQWREDFVGRFSAQRASLQTIYVQPNVAYEVVPGKLSLGAGFIVGHSTLELRQALDFSQQLAPAPAPPNTHFAQLGIAPGTEFGRAVIKGDAVAYGFNLGAHLQATPTLSIGARYLSKVTFDYEDADATFTVSPLASSYVFPLGNALRPTASFTLAELVAPNFAAGGPLAPGQHPSTSLSHPAQFQVGVGYTGLANTTLSADYAFVQWSAFEELPVNFGATSPLTRTLFEDYDNSSSFRLGAEHKYRSGLAARAGFSYAQTPAPDETVTPLLPDMDRYNLALGVGIPLGSALVLDASYLRVETEGRRGRSGERASRAETAAQLNNGWYALNANIFSASLKLQF